MNSTIDSIAEILKYLLWIAMSKLEFQKHCCQIAQSIGTV